MKRKSSEGQILLVVVLTMIVALTVGLSIAARIVTELKLSKQNEESQRAFQAAESGIEQSLRRQSSIGSVQFDNNAAFSTTFEAVAKNSIVLNNGLEVDQGVGADVWLSDYNPDPALQFLNPIGSGNPVDITIFWGSPNQTGCDASGEANTAPALEIVALIGPKNNPTIARSVYEAPGCNNRVSPNNQNVMVGTRGLFTIDGVQFNNTASLRFNGASVTNGLIMKVIPIFGSTVVGMQAQPGIIFPPQGSVVTSTGKAGDTVRKVEYFKSYPQIPLEIFPFSILSQ